MSEAKITIKQARTVATAAEAMTIKPLLPNGMELLYDLHTRYVKFDKQIEILISNQIFVSHPEVGIYRDRIFKKNREYIKDTGDFNYDFAFRLESPKFLNVVFWCGSFRTDPFEKIIVITDQTQKTKMLNDFEPWKALETMAMGQIESKAYNDYRAKMGI